MVAEICRIYGMVLQIRQFLIFPPGGAFWFVSCVPLTCAGRLIFKDVIALRWNACPVFEAAHDFSNSSDPVPIAPHDEDADEATLRGADGSVLAFWEAVRMSEV